MGAFHCGDVKLDAAGFLLAFDGKAPHYSEEFEGTRVALIFHTMAGFFADHSRWSSQLTALGFPTPARPAPQPQAGPSRVLRFLYLFAGPERRGSIASFMQALAQAYGAAGIEATEVDILRGDDHDLSRHDRQVHYVMAVGAGEYDFVLSSPAGNMWSRALWANPSGPPVAISLVVS